MAREVAKFIFATSLAPQWMFYWIEALDSKFGRRTDAKAKHQEVPFFSILALVQWL